MSRLQMKWLGMVALGALSLFLLYPSINWYTMEAGERAALEASRSRPKWLLNLGLDLKGGTHLLMELEAEKLPPDIKVQDALAQAIEIIRNRVDQFGVAEPLVARQGERWIVVQLPGVTNSAAAKALVGKTALLEFRMVQDTDAAVKALQKIAEIPGAVREGKATPEAAKLAPAGMSVLSGRDNEIFLVSSTAPLTGAALETARVETGGDYGLPIVSFRFRPEFANAFSQLTAANVGKRMAIVLDGVVYSAPVIKGRIGGGSGIIEGQFDMDDARSLAIVLRAGALPAPVKVIEERTVGATLGEDSIRSGLRACAIGIGSIFVFFVIYYKLLGIFAVGALIINLTLLVAIMAYFGSTLTLPGIAGISLNVAMAVDANILILERIREELKKGKPLRAALESGYDMSAAAILDSNLTVLAASILLFQFGTGPIKGFAVTLTIGNLISMFTSTIVTRLMSQSWIAASDSHSLSWSPFEAFTTPSIDWISKRGAYFAFSGALMAVSLGALATKGFNYGIDFVGGTLVEVTYTQPKTLTQFRQDLEKAGYPEADPQSFSGTQSFAVRMKGSEKMDAAAMETFLQKLQAADSANAMRVDRKEFVGPSVGRHLKKQALLAISLAILAIIVYVAFRFSNPLWGAAGVVAMVHDVIATAGLFSLTGREVDLVIVAAFLTIAGYSINDTIVIFDRMRERMRHHRKESLSETINMSVNETLSRTLLTNANVLVVTLVLFFFGGEVIHNFALAMVFGGFVGTYSTVAIAAPLIYARASKHR
jgi:SecD/SecF fusion protein